jgi:hypothetical protein
VLFVLVRGALVAMVSLILKLELLAAVVVVVAL